MVLNIAEKYNKLNVKNVKSNIKFDTLGVPN